LVHGIPPEELLVLVLLELVELELVELIPELELVELELVELELVELIPELELVELIPELELVELIPELDEVVVELALVEAVLLPLEVVELLVPVLLEVGPAPPDPGPGWPSLMPKMRLHAGAERRARARNAMRPDVKRMEPSVPQAASFREPARTLAPSDRRRHPVESLSARFHPLRPLYPPGWAALPAR
jgi:hypothetical protein